MKVYLFFGIKALVAMVFGLLMLFLPMMSSSWFGIEVSPDGSMMVQLVGAFLIGIAIICFFSSRSESSLAVRNTMLGLAVLDTLAFVVMLLGQIKGLMDPTGVVLIIMWAVFAVAAWIYWVVGGRTV